MSSGFFFGGSSALLDATTSQDGFASALMDRYGPNGVQNVRGHEIFAVQPPRPNAASGASMPLALPRMPGILPTPSSMSAPGPFTSPMPSSSQQPASDITFAPTTVEDLPTLLSDSYTLIIDLRTHAQYANARLPRAMSLSVPSTLVKRPAFPLSKLADMLPPGARARLSQWPSASRVLVYDADGAPPSAGSNIAGLLRKFVAEGCPSTKLSWLEGGFQNVWRQHRELVDADPPSDDDDDASGEEADEPKRATLQTRQLPAAAFTSTSTTRAAVTPQADAASTSSHVAFNPFFDAIRQNLELSQGITERIPLQLAPSALTRIDDLPFSWLRDIARHAGHIRPRTISVDRRPAQDALMHEGAENLAMQFYRIELAEQRRLTGIMHHHSKEDAGAGDAQPSSAPFPYSITAGVEKGAKNRYRNIWPFEHARVRLQRRVSNDDDYINASYVQPLGTDKRYIATQGPLPATFNDFWALVWEQNVHVIVMLTREIEGSMVKCGNYWADGQYGRLRLRLVSTTGPPTSDDVVKPDATPSPFFASAPVQSPDGPPTITRTFELTHTSFPYVKARTITHFQYTEWPDMNVPESPTGLLDLIRSVGTATAQTEENINIEVVRSRSNSNWTGSAGAQACKISGIAKHALGHRPLLLHCSAGVGRTGGFITVDAVLDGIRRELSDTHLTVSPQFGDMVVDSSESTDDNTPGRSMVDASVSMDVDAPSSTSQHTPSRSLGGPSSSRDDLKASRTSPKMSAYRKGRGAGANAWGKNDPRRMPLRKWLVSTTDAAAREAQLASPAPHALTANDAPLVASPLPVQGKILSPPLTASPLPTPSTRMDGPMGDDQPTKTARATFPLMSAPRLLAPDAPRTRAFSTPTSTEGVGARRLALGNVTSSMLAGSPVASMSSTNLPSVLSSAVVPSVFSSDAAESSMTSDASPPPSTAPPKTLLGVPAPTPTQALTPPSTTAAFDYTAPRMLHTSTAPLTLSSFSEPIRAVIEDAREQRMSLCQSLRQYVFVHQAIVEGALAIVDELRAAEAGSESAQADVSMSTLQAPPSMRPNKAKRRRSTMDADVIREDSKGAVSLSKRPSIKRVADGSRA